MHAATVVSDFSTHPDAFVAAISEPALDRIDACRAAVVLAHPDDETIGCGAQLARLNGVTVVVVTDGAPRNLHDARRLGFSTAEDYAAARERELAEALTIAGVGHDQTIALRVPDQQAAFQLHHISRELAALFARRDIGSVITHAYEGGHPDHDATAFCVHAAAELRRRAGHSVGIVEVPLYRLGPGGIVRQQFDDRSPGSEIRLWLSPRQKDLKRRMTAAHRTQRDVLAPFAIDVESFRPAPRYDFSKPPNDGRLFYESYPWGLDGAQWNRLACSALDELAEDSC